MRPDDYGQKPNQAAIEYDDKYKMRHNADPPLKPFESTEDLLDMLLYNGSSGRGGGGNVTSA